MIKQHVACNVHVNPYNVQLCVILMSAVTKESIWNSVLSLQEKTVTCVSLSLIYGLSALMAMA